MEHDPKELVAFSGHYSSVAVLDDSQGCQDLRELGSISRESLPVEQMRLGVGGGRWLNQGSPF
jgi:hypothetical protein